MTTRIQIVARIEPDLRRRVARAAKRQKTTLNAVVAAALRAYVDRVTPEPAPTQKETR
jgi:predicted HicB family RNase H-like nuclease